MSKINYDAKKTDEIYLEKVDTKRFVIFGGWARNVLGKGLYPIFNSENFKFGTATSIPDGYKEIDGSLTKTKFYSNDEADEILNFMFRSLSDLTGDIRKDLEKFYEKEIKDGKSTVLKDGKPNRLGLLERFLNKPIKRETVQKPSVAPIKRTVAPTGMSKKTTMVPRGSLLIPILVDLKQSNLKKINEPSMEKFNVSFARIEVDEGFVAREEDEVVDEVIEEEEERQEESEEEEESEENGTDDEEEGGF